MAGIGFELKRLFRRKGLFATMRAYGYAGIVCTGPMLLGVLLQVGILVLCGLWGVGRANQDLLVCMVTYTLLASLALTSFFSMPVTRFLADMLFAEREDEILPSFWGSNAIMLVAGTVLYGVFLLFSGATLLQGLLCLWLFNIMIVNWNGMSYLTAIKDYRGILCSFAAAIGMACLCALAALALGLPPVEGLLASIALGYGVMLAWDVVLLYRYFPQSDRSPWRFLRWLDQFMPLALTGLFTNLGLFVHLVIIWAGPIGVQIKGLFYGAPYHDVPALIAFLTTLVTTVNFVVSVEVNFYPRYRDYYSLFNDGGVVGDIVVAEEEMLSTLNSELRFCALKQLFVTAAVISLETTVLSALPLGFNNLMHGYFRTLCVGYGLYAVGNTVMLILLYFTDYKGAVLASGLFAGVAGLATAVSLLLPQQFYGFGFLLGAAVFFIVALLRLDTYTANLPYRILSQQPIVATDKTGRFTQLGRLLDRAEQRYEECRRKGVPHGAFQRAVVRVYRNHWGGVLMIDKLMSRRCLIEAAAGALLLSGCSSQDESSTKKVKKQGKIKKADASDRSKHLHDKDELYEVYDDSGIVTMYLTVSRGNSSENTDHSWAEINTYSVYDYADMGVTRYQVMGLLQPGDEEGPVAGEVGYGEEAPNATVQVRGQTSSGYTQKNYKVELKKGKGTWRQQRAIALNKHMGEGMRFRNKMAYDLIRGIPQMMGLRTQFVHLWVCDQTEKSNDTFEDYGLFTQVEQLNKTALKAHGLDKNGHLYKVNSFDFHRYEDTIKLADDPDYNQANFEGMLEIKGDSDHTKLIEMLDALNDESQKIDDVLDTYFDTENLVYWLAFQILTGNCDTQNRNCYLYSPLNSNTWYILDWDNDGMLRKLELSLAGFSDYASWERGVSNYWGNVLFNRALRSKSFRSELDRAVKDLRSYMTEARLSKMIKHYREVTESLVFASPDIDNLPVTKDQYEQIAAAIPCEIEENYKSFRESYKKPMPFYIGVPQIDNGKLRINWDASYDFKARDIRYTVELARDYAVKDVFFKAEDVLLPEVTCDAPDTGQYFVRVRATNSDGYTQDAFDYYVTDDGKHYGMKCFYVQDGGKVVEDTYEEG